MQSTKFGQRQLRQGRLRLTKVAHLYKRGASRRKERRRKKKEESKRLELDERKELIEALGFMDRKLA